MNTTADSTADADDIVAYPRMALTAGVTGHRLNALPDAAIAPLTMTIEAILRRIGVEIAACRSEYARAFAPAPPLLRLVTALAEGADSIAAHAAIAAGCELDVCLPFPRADYAADFTEGAARAQLATLIAAACEIIELPGTRAAEQRAYEAVGMTMLSLSDIVIVVWNGTSAGGRGGTAEILAEAVERGVPVVHVSLDAATPPVIIWSGLESLPLARPTLWSAPRRDFEAAIGDVIRTLVAPPAREAGDVDLAATLSQVPRRSLLRYFAWPVMLALLGVKRHTRTAFVSALPTSPLPVAQDAADTDAAFHGRMRTHLLGLGIRADALANQFGHAHRSAFVLNFALAALAVALAMIPVLSSKLKIYAAPAEFIVILIIAANTWIGLRQNRHEKWLEFRHLAERSRILAFSLRFGEPLLRFENADRAGGVPDWVRWRSRAAARATGMPTLRVDDAELARMRARLIAATQEQIAYHDHSAAQMHLLDHRTHNLGFFLFGLTLAVTGVFILGLALHMDEAVHTMAGLVTFLSAAAPAAGAAIYGIRVQGEFASSAHRSHVMADQLRQLCETIRADPLNYQLIADRMRRLATILLRNTADWRLTFESRPFGLPS